MYWYACVRAGAYTVVEGAPVPIKSQPSPLIPLLLALVAIMYGATQLGRAVTGEQAAAGGGTMYLR